MKNSKFDVAESVSFFHFCYKNLICERIVTWPAAPALCAKAGAVLQTLSSSVSSCPALFVVSQFTVAGLADVCNGEKERGSRRKRDGYVMCELGI